MGSLLFPLAIVITILFIVLPIVLYLSIVNRYKKVEKAIQHDTATVRALIAYLERGQKPNP
jgi:hypothetical protein